MGLQDALYAKRVSFDSPEAVEFNDAIMEAIAFYAYSASADLAAERGRYPSFQGSKWDRGLLPLDTLNLLEEALAAGVHRISLARGSPFQVSSRERCSGFTDCHTRNCWTRPAKPRQLTN